MAYDRRSFAGAAVATTLDGAIDGSALSITIAASTGWPSGSNGDFFVVIDRGTATEEKVQIASRTSLSLTVATGGRGADGTAAVAHSSGAAIELCLTAVDLDEANAHIADTTLDHHSQYLNTTRHDVEARHTFGAALGTPTAAADIGTTASAGTGDNPAREDHVHQIGTGAIDTAAQFAAGVVDTDALADEAVTYAKMQDVSATDRLLGRDTASAGSVEELTVSGGIEFTGSGGIQTSAFTGDVTKTAGGTALSIGAGVVDTTELADDAVTTAKIADANVTDAKLEEPTVVGSTVATTSLGGDISITFGETFASAPTVVVCNGDSAQDFAVMAVKNSSVTTTGCEVRCWNAAGDEIVSTQLRVNWMAKGALA